MNNHMDCEHLDVDESGRCLDCGYWIDEPTCPDEMDDGGILK